MAGAGGLLFLFVIGHLVGNLQVFGPLNSSTTTPTSSKANPMLVWGARLSLLVIIGLHITTALQLTVANKAARPVGYSGGEAYGSSWQSRYMLMRWLVIAAFIVYHLAHFTALLPGINGVGDFRLLETELQGEKFTTFTR